jgi:BirA family biotin operon repressor/biotin-[acetyl-CoA-carboxylase] ligase
MNFEIKHIRHHTLPSTHTWAKEHIAELDPEGITCITTIEQSAGQGQFQRRFVCAPGNLYATFYFCLPQEASYISHLGQLLSLSCVTVLEKKGVSCQIKWPNDILLDGKKLAGVLCDNLALETKRAIVLSIGVNVNMTQEILDTIDQPATSLAVFSKKPWDEQALLDALCIQFLSDLQEIMQQGFTPFLARYDRYLIKKIEKNLGSQ